MVLVSAVRTPHIESPACHPTSICELLECVATAAALALRVRAAANPPSPTSVSRASLRATCSGTRAIGERPSHAAPSALIDDNGSMPMLRASGTGTDIDTVNAQVVGDCSENTRPYVVPTSSHPAARAAKGMGGRMGVPITHGVPSGKGDRRSSRVKKKEL